MMQNQKIFGKSIGYYFVNLSPFYLFIVIVYAGLRFVEKLILRVGRSIDPARLSSLVKFLHVLQIIGVAFILYLIARKLFRNVRVSRFRVIGQAVVVGAVVGFIIGIINSVFNFIYTLTYGKIGDAIIDLISFLWISWKEVFIVITVIEVMLGIIWLSKHSQEIQDKFHELKQSIKEEDEEEE